MESSLYFCHCAGAFLNRKSFQTAYGTSGSSLCLYHRIRFAESGSWFSGELSLGHAGFMCVGAFSSALFSQVAADSIPQVPRFILAILVGAAVAALFGVIIGIPVLRLRGDYLAIVTLAFGEIIKNLINVLYIGVDDKGIHVATSAAGLHLEAGGKQILKGALGISGTATLYKDIKSYFS